MDISLRHDRFRVYHPVTEGGTPIYVHAKILIIDDRVLRIGEADGSPFDEASFKYQAGVTGTGVDQPANWATVLLGN